MELETGQIQLLVDKSKTKVLLQLQVLPVVELTVLSLYLGIKPQGKHAPLLMIEFATGQIQRFWVKLKTKVALH
jgi:hypothetical protein